MATHTPGPWAVDSNGPGHEVVLARGGAVAVAAVQGPDDPEENLSNAHLIAAAPDLYAALRKMALFVADWRDCLEGVQMTEATFRADSGLTEARAALAKAEGR